MACRLTRLRLLALWLGILGAAPAWGGGGPENVLLVVNANSTNSKTLANHYIALRNIPSSNVVYVDWRGGLELAQGQFWAEGVLKPAVTAIGERGLSAQIDYVVYSCDLPWRVNLTSLLPASAFNDNFRPEGSSTGLTYLWQLVRDKSESLPSPQINWYISPNDSRNLAQCQVLSETKSRAFHSRYFWAPDGKVSTNPKLGQSYLLSTSLGVTTGRGNSMSEILDYLNRAVEADGTRPRGTFYYMQNNNARSLPRHDCYGAAAAEVNQAGSRAVVSAGTIPNGAQDVLGIMTGTEKFSLSSSNVRLLPGAIGDNLTSYGGILLADFYQTPLSEFLRYGAAGASGTVFEPKAMQAKFPLPSLFIHYARGCSLAESFFQSVSGPYQLLIVGDPLCQPFAVIPEVTFEDLKPGQEVKGTLTIQAKATVAAPKQVRHLELYIDGRMIARYEPGRAPNLDTTKLPDGYHEFRVVATNGDAIESRGGAILPLLLNNHGQKLELTTPNSKVAATGTVRLSIRQPGATSVVVRQNGREVARVEGGEGQAEVLAATLGRGPVVLVAESSGPQPARSEPLQLEVQ